MAGTACHHSPRSANHGRPGWVTPHREPRHRAARGRTACCRRPAPQGAGRRTACRHRRASRVSAPDGWSRPATGRRRRRRGTRSRRSGSAGRSRSADRRRPGRQAGRPSGPAGPCRRCSRCGGARRTRRPSARGRSPRAGHGRPGFASRAGRCSGPSCARPPGRRAGARWRCAGSLDLGAYAAKPVFHRAEGRDLLVHQPDERLRVGEQLGPAGLVGVTGRLVGDRVRDHSKGPLGERGALHRALLEHGITTRGQGDKRGRSASRMARPRRPDEPASSA